MINFFSLIIARPIQEANLRACCISKISFYESFKFIFMFYQRQESSDAIKIQLFRHQYAINTQSLRHSVKSKLLYATIMPFSRYC